MKFLKNYLIVFFSLLFLLPGLAQDKVLQVTHARTNQPLENAHILYENQVVGYTDLDGIFNASDFMDSVSIQLLGFETKTILLEKGINSVYLSPKIYRLSDEVIVYAHNENNLDVQSYSSKTLLTLDHMLSNVDGVSMIKRGAFAWEPSIRGMDDQRINLTIDGMQVFKACVDKMDPITSYVESDNLSHLEIDKSGSNVAENGNGKSSINLVTKRPEFEPLKLSIKSGVRFPDYYRVASLNSDASVKNHAFRFSGSYKQAENLVAGDQFTVSNTSFNKLNLNIAYRIKTKSNNVFDVNYIFDDARDVGYPALLMDATRATANMLRVQYDWKEELSQFTSTSLTAYINEINHWMDDYGRDVAKRSVMQNMYMPMYGSTQTVGIKLVHNLSLKNQVIPLFFDGYYSNAFGDMAMESLFDIEDMYIVNLGDIDTRSLRFGARARISLSQSILLKLEQSTEFNQVELTDQNSLTFFEGIHNKAINPRNRFLFSGSTNLLWMASDEVNFSFKSIVSQRQANYIELYGHYIYNYVDGFFYDGNPFLSPETSLNLEFTTNYKTGNHSTMFSVFHKNFHNYISGVLEEDISNGFYQFKQYANVGNAFIAGFDLRWITSWSRWFSTDLRTSFTHGQNTTIDEPLPLISPLKGFFSSSYTGTQFKASATVEWATKQQRIAQFTSIEDRTSEYAILNLELSKSWLQDKITSSIEIQNLFDTYYNQHTSIGNIPEIGRSFMLTLKYDL